MKNNFIVIIPARFQSSRFPGKPLVDIYSKPMIQRVFEQAEKANPKRIIIATDNDQIYSIASSFCNEVVMTKSSHQSGIERISEVIETLNINKDEIIVNLQGDEPLIPPENIIQVASNIKDTIAISTLAYPIEDQKDVSNPNIVKVIKDFNNKAIYFSRSKIPFNRDNYSNNTYLRHIGLYAYKASYINTYINYPSSILEESEKLEQLRAIYYGDKIYVDLALVEPPIGVDTQEDLENIIRIFKEKNI
ncbi:MAG: 3-deoxy-manno-octulosonate cytidylyltransferase [Psittacicella sp.]